MTTLTLKEADRYLVNHGFVCTGSADLSGEYQASYAFGNLGLRPPRGMTFTLRDFGNGRWTYNLIAFSENLADKARETQEALKGLPGFEAHQV